MTIEVDIDKRIYNPWDSKISVYVIVLNTPSLCNWFTNQNKSFYEPIPVSGLRKFLTYIITKMPI